MSGPASLPELYSRLREASPQDRESRLEELARGDAELAARLRRMLRAETRSDSLLDSLAGAGVPASVGPYRLLREIGRGGMGRVFLAEQKTEDFERAVALKVLATPGLGPDDERRFRAERRILAGLEHPGIARFLDGGRAPDGTFFLAMEYVEGQDLLAHAAARQLSIGERVRLFLGVLEAVRFAHSRLIVHRDLKPANILVDSGGRPRLLDFGISKLVDPGDGEMAVTRTELRAWTPAYASPEQIRGESAGVASDVYSLGVVLYELLSDERPHRAQAGSARALERAVLEEEPRPPSQAAADRAIARLLTGDLDAIVLKALRKEPEERYASAEAFAEDLRRYLDGRPVVARRGGRRYQIAKFARRHRAGLTAAALAFAALAVGLGMALWQRSAAIAEREIAQRRLADVQGLARSLLFEVHDAVEQLPGSAPVQKRIAERALLYLQKLEQEAGDDPALLADLASGYERLGRVTAGAPGFGTHLVARSGDGGEPAFSRAIALRRRLTTLPGDSPASRLALARVLADHAEAQRSVGHLDAMRRAFTEAAALAQGLAAAAPQDADLRFERAAILIGRAHGERTLAPGKPEFESARREALAAGVPLLRDPPPAAERASRYAHALGVLGQLLNEAERYDEADLATRLGLEALTPAPQAPRDRFRDATLATLLQVRMRVAARLEHWPEALASAERSAALHRVWLDEPESRRGHAVSLYASLTAGAAAAIALRDPAGALSMLDEASALKAAEGWSGVHALSAAANLADLRGDALALQAITETSAAERRKLRAAAASAYREALRGFEQLGSSPHGDFAGMLPEIQAKLVALEGAPPPRAAR